VIAQLELEWLGGPAASRFRRRRPGADDLPWGSLAAAAPSLPDEVAAAARASFTDGAFSEYASAAAFAALASALLEAGAPIDLIAMAGDFVVDEMVHVELNARLAMELGGAAPYAVDLDKVAPLVDAALPAIERAAELAVKISCIGEALSVPVLSGSLRAAGHPLVRAVLARLARDEPPHARIGWLILDWAEGRLDAARLAVVAGEALAAYAPLWRQASDDADPAHRRTLGWMDGATYRRALTRAVRERVARPLAARGIAVDTARLDLGEPGGSAGPDLLRGRPGGRLRPAGRSTQRPGLFPGLGEPWRRR